MDIQKIRKLISKNKFSIVDHALLESFKDGIEFDEILYTINHGKIIEDYPERKRCLVFCTLLTNIYLHVVVDYCVGNTIDIVTVYIPSSSNWIKGCIRRRK
jgi:hypothetical protein